jgi:exodeoxyribonuclease VII small subunit
MSRRREVPPAASTPVRGAVEELSFEDALERLETLVDQLEQGDLDLEEALAAFEQGVALTRRCAGQLEDAERRVEVLVREGEKWFARPFEEPEGADPSEEPEEVG